MGGREKEGRRCQDTLMANTMEEEKGKGGWWLMEWVRGRVRGRRDRGIVSSRWEANRGKGGRLAERRGGRFEKRRGGRFGEGRRGRFGKRRGKRGKIWEEKREKRRKIWEEKGHKRRKIWKGKREGEVGWGREKGKEAVEGKRKGKRRLETRGW